VVRSHKTRQVLLESRPAGSREQISEKTIAKIPMAAVLRAVAIGETRGFVKMLIDVESDRILGFTVFGMEASEMTAAVQTAMLGGLSYTVLRDAIFTHPTAAEGLGPLLATIPARALRQPA